MLASAHAQSTESKFRLLYLGSDLTLIAALRKELTEPVYRLVACSDREGAIMFLKSEIPYDLLLIDLEWQAREGLKVAQLTGSLTQREGMPIVLVGVELSKHTMKLASRAGVNKCVTKTPDMGAVSETIQQMIEGVKR